MHCEGAKVLAGGTDQIVAMRLRISLPRRLVDITAIPELSFIDYREGEGLKIGATTTLKAIAASPIIRERFPFVARAASKVASPQVREAATLGGNLCLDTRCWYFNQSEFWRSARPLCLKTCGEVCYVKKGVECMALFSGDMAPTLIASRAKVTIAGVDGERTVPLEDIYSGDGLRPLTIGPHEVLVQVEVPELPKGARTTYLKLAPREAIDFPVIGLAALLKLDGDIDVALVASAIKPRPYRLIEAEGVIREKGISPETIREAGERAMKEVGALYLVDNVPYKKESLALMVKRALKELYDEATHKA